MRGLLRNILFVCLGLALGKSAWAGSYGVVSPTATAPVRVKPGEAFTVKIAIPVALTPPPGVQKAAVWRDWRVVLRRKVQASYGTADRTLRYHMRFLKIRPCEQNIDYLVTAESQTWLPSGKYRVDVYGPGFSYGVDDAVIVDGDRDSDDEVAITRIGDGKWTVTPTDQSSEPRWFELVVGKKVPGIRIELNDKPAKIDDIFWASFSFKSQMRGSAMDYRGGADGRRLVRVALSPDVSNVAVSRQVPVGASTGKADVGIDFGQAFIRPMEWVSVQVRTTVVPLKSIWLFADGDNAVGEKTTYRWMVTTEAVAQVTVFDEYGTVHTVKARRPLRMPLSRDDGGICGFHGQRGQGNSLLGHVFNTCFETILLLLE